ncbi:MAG TPA: preprotein translocase subunit SecE [Rhodanobacteraceae bacterium]|nr:preprotein translocase subunit SecE [Rhodanobacteraceae bacterium]
MNTKAEQANGAPGADMAKLVLAVLVLAAGIFGFYWFDQMAQMARVGMLVVGIVAAGVIANFTGLGAKTRHFLAETRFEMRKVVWPTRDETVKTTVVVLVVVIILALLLGLIDLILKSVILDWLLNVGQ